MRLHRVGAKHQPSYRIVITPALSPRDGSYLDQVGFYDPITEPATIRIDNDKAIDWLRKGVEPTHRVARLLSAVNIDPEQVRRPDGGVTEAETKPAGQSRSKAATESLPATEPVGAVSAEEEVKPKRTRRSTAAAAEAEPVTTPEEAGDGEPEKPVRKRAPRKTAAKAEGEPE